jgi:hypothetical protein
VLPLAAAIVVGIVLGVVRGHAQVHCTCNCSYENFGYEGEVQCVSGIKLCFGDVCEIAECDAQPCGGGEGWIKTCIAPEYCNQIYACNPCD